MAKSPKSPSKTRAAASRKSALRGKASANKSRTRPPADTGEISVVFGTITFANARPAAGLNVIAFDKDESREDRLGQATTDVTGAYKIPYSASTFRRSPKERGGADVIVRVYNEQNELLFTSKAKNNAPAEYRLNVQLSAPRYVVRGIVNDANGKPLPNMIVRALDRDLRFPQLLGTDETGANGDYRIDYCPDDFRLGDLPSRRAPWLIVEVRETAEGEPLARQEVQRADRNQILSFSLSNVGAISEWQRIGEAVGPLLKGQGRPSIETGTRATREDLPPEDITASDLDFIVIETGLDRTAVLAWAASSRMVRDAVLRLTDEHATQQCLLREHGWSFFYALVRQGGANNLDAVLRNTTSDWQRAWKAARAVNQTLALDEQQVERLMAVLSLLRRMQQLEMARADNSDFARVLAHAPLPLPVTVALDALAVVRDRGLDDTDALLKLAERYPEAEAPIKTFVRSVRVHRLAGGHGEFSRVLNGRLDGVSDSIEPLARMRAVDWIGMAEEAGVSPGLALRTQAHAERQYPLAALESNIHTGTFDLPSVSGGDVAALFKKQPALVEKLLLGKAPVKADETEIHKTIRNTGRFLRTGVSMELAANLIKGGIGSPGKALLYGRDFIRRQLLDSPQAAAQEVIDGFFATAEPLVNGGKGVVLEVDSNRHYPSWMMEEYTVPLPEAVRENAPTLAALFGDLDECLCRPCESMLGQPAYLVDLLNLLAKSSGKNGNALDELRSRRPDIFNLKLSCENAEQSIQHLDIVLEILEKAAAREAAPGATAAAIRQIAYPKLRQALYPWHLPFDPGYAGVRAYLEKFGVSREKLLGLRRGTMPAHLASEALHAPMDQAGTPNADSQWNLLTQQRLGARLWAAYGFNIDNDIRIVDPASGELLTNQTVEDVLTRASILIDRTGLSLEELEQTLKTAFVSGDSNGIDLSGREQCKTSAMRLPAEGSVLEGILDRLHRFMRLRAHMPGWSIETLGQAIVVCGGIESGATTDQQRADLLVRLTILKRLHEAYGMPLDALLEQPISDTRLRKALGLSIVQCNLLKELIGYMPTTQPTDWSALEELCHAARCLQEIGLTVEQAAHALLTRGRWEAVAGELPASIKSGEQIEELLGSIQQRLRSVVAVRPDVSLETQVAEALNDIYERTTVSKIMQGIREASGPSGRAPGAAVLTELMAALSGGTGHSLGEWLPLMDAQHSAGLFSVAATNNRSVEERLVSLLAAIASRRRERELIAVLSEQCGLAEADAISLLGGRLLLDPAQGQSVYASEAFLSGSFWADVSSTQPVPPSVTAAAMPRLHAWVDRLYRLIALSTALAIDSELMQIAERIIVGAGVGINWRDMLASAPANSTVWQNPQWQALLDLLWLQQPDQFSRGALGDLLNRLVASVAQVSADTVRPLTARVDVAETLAVPLMAQALSLQPGALPSRNDLRSPGKLRLVFEWLLLAKQLGASAIQMAQLTDLAGNLSAADTAKSLLEAKLAGDDLQVTLRRIGDSLRRQRRDALVAYHVAQIVGRNNSDKWSDAKALYEYFLIDHQMEPCFETTRILEAVTAAQLFAQRILFGVELEITADPELKQRWSWMRNYRVWEANRKVFLFPENWLFPELRDDKSSSFKRLESALGQGELTEDLANRAFGQFLDDVAQMGQMQVLGMYEDISRDANGNILKDNSNQHPIRRTLYIIGRTLNPPYAYFWRHCVDFGSPYMEWSPWQRIELDIQGDHVLPFVLNGSLCLSWPIVKKREPTSVNSDAWEITVAWSRHIADRWSKSDIARNLVVIPAGPFRDDRLGFSFRLRVEESSSESLAVVTCYAAKTTLVPAPPQSEATRDVDAEMVIPQAKPADSILRYQMDNATQRNLSVGASWPPEWGKPEDSASREVSWSCWISVRAGNGTGWMQLRSEGAGHHIEIRDETGVEQPIRLGQIRRWFVFGESSQAARLASIGSYGYVPSVQWRAHAELQGQQRLTLASAEAISVTHVDTGRSVRDHLVFHLNASQYTPEELGLELDGLLSFEAISDFVISESRDISLRPASGYLLGPTNTRSWMNGFMEVDARNAGRDFFLEFIHADGPITATTIFQGQGADTYFALPANANRAKWEEAAVWYFSEHSGSCIVDLAPVPQGTVAQFTILPSSFPESVDYATRWRRGLLRFSIDEQEGIFGADLLPQPGGRLSRTGPLALTTGGILDERAQSKFTFDNRLPYVGYNWEVFFHAPLLIADHLSKQHKFEDAERWLRCVFDPTSSDADTDAKRFLKFRVFKELDLNQQVIDDLTALAQVAGGYASDVDVGVVHKLIDRWRNAPFRPFLIARRRHIAFLWRTLFAYLDNLIAWADSLYRRDTRESINEATMLYVLAERILGRRPQLHQGKTNRPAYTYDEKISSWDEFANFWIDVGAQGPSNLKTAWRVKDTLNQPNPEGMLYFCMPFNDKIVSYWNIVDARLGNIRNCRNIEGIQRQLPLLDAPIDPELLVRATAAGLDLGEVISGLYAPPPHYRYSILSARAVDLVNECKSLGGAMLSAIEKRDAEQLAQLRSSNEINLLNLVRDVRQLQITEAERNIEALRAGRKSLESRYNQYQRLLGKKDIALPKEQERTGEESMLGTADSGIVSNRSNWGLIKEENEQYTGIDGAVTWATASGIAKTVGGGFHTSASIVLATPAGATTNAPKVLEALGTSASYIGDAFSMVSQGWKTYAEQQGMMAGHIRRRDEWAFQSNQALKELQQVDKQILANQIRIDITRKELDNHIEQLEQARAVDEVMRGKFSNVQLYEWMKTELSRLHFTAYRMAVDMARRAERAASRELGVKPLNIVRNDYWDSLRDGLLAGERLHQDLKRLEIAYLDQNRREYELTKHISLRRLDPEALANLRVKDSNGHCRCEFKIPEWLLDLDTPGHYLRRIKSVSVSIPSVTGPYTSVSCKLTLLKSAVRHERTAANYPRVQGDDLRFTDNFGASEAIVTSSGNGDSGLFETQLREERFLPFEGSGVISTWRLELPGKYPQFDYATISDVVLSIRYTARDGGDDLRTAATEAIDAQLSLPSTSTAAPLRFPVALSCRSDFPSEWARAGTTSDLKVSFTRNLLPYWMDAAGLAVREVRVADVPKAARSPLDFKLVWPPPTGVTDPAPWPADALNGDGVGEGNLGRVIGVVDKIILLNVGTRTNPLPSPP